MAASEMARINPTHQKWAGKNSVVINVSAANAKKYSARRLDFFSSISLVIIELLFCAQQCAIRQ
jgi:hypothetical protein